MRRPGTQQTRMDTMPQSREASRLQVAAAAARPRAELRCGRGLTYGHRPSDEEAEPSGPRYHASRLSK